MYRFLLVMFALILNSCGGGGGNSPETGQTVTPSPTIPPIVVIENHVYCTMANDNSIPFHEKGTDEGGLEYYLICAEAELAEIKDGYLGDNFKLGRDLDMDNYYTYTGPDVDNSFTIGSHLSPFTGNFSGDGWGIHNFQHINHDDDYSGLFAVIDGGVVSFLLLDNVSFESGVSSFSGGLAGRIKGGIVFAVGIQSGYAQGMKVGGFAGQLDNTSIAYSYSNIELRSVSAVPFMGGFAGFNEGPSIIDSSFFSGEIEAGALGTNKGGVFGVTPPITGTMADVELIKVMYNSESVLFGCPSDADCGGAVSSVDLSVSPLYFTESNHAIFSSWETTNWIFEDDELPYLE